MGGQAAVEMAIVLPVLLLALLVAVQFALIGNAYLALGQATYQGARYAAVNPSASQSTVLSYMLSVGSPTITGNSGNNLTMTLSPDGTPRTFGSSLTVSTTFNVKSLVVLPNPFLGVPFPTSLSSTESAMSE